MAYKKQNFARGQTLYASQLNAMDGQIAANEAAIKENKRAIEALPSGGGTTLTGAQAATLDAGSAATAEIVDTVDGKVLKIGVPRGEKGDKGDTGPQGAQANVDTTLTVSGAAADAAAVGTRFGAVEGAQTVLEGRVTALEGGSIAVDETLTQSGKAADAKAVGDAVQGLQAAHDNLAAQVGAIQPGLTQAEKSALLTLLGGAAYGSDDMAATYASLKALWEGGDVPVMAVNVTPATLNMTVGGTATLKATVIPGTATDKTVSWSVSPTGIVNVNGGNVEAVSVGECVITATAGGVSGTCTVSVQAAAIPATKVTLNKNTLALNTSDVETLTATVTPANSTDAVVWTASPDGIVSVTGGVVEALKAGECVITATAGSASATCSVTVTVKTNEITVDTITPSASHVWSTATPLCQSVYTPITAKQDFTLKHLDFTVHLTADTSIEVSFYNKTDSKNEGTNVTLAGTTGDYHVIANLGNIDIVAGNEYQIWVNSASTVMCYPYVTDSMVVENDYFNITGTEYRWSNSYIKYMGYIVLEPAQTSGTVAVKSVTLNKSTLNMTVGDSQTLTATVLPANSTDRNVLWSVSPSGYATVTGGVVKATAAGNCTVTASCGGKSASCNVTVQAASSVNTNPFPAITPAYILPTAKTFAPVNAEVIDTGVKLFETINPAPSFTILFEVQGGDGLSALRDTYVAMHCMDESKPWPGLTIQALPNGQMQMSLYSSATTFGMIAEWKESKHRMALRVSNGSISGWRVDGNKTAWGAISGMTAAVDKTLLLGGYQTSAGVKGRFFDGTFYQCIVYSEALTDEQIGAWVAGTV